MSITLCVITLFVVSGAVLAILNRARDKGDGSEPHEAFAVISIAQAFDPDFAILWAHVKGQAEPVIMRSDGMHDRERQP